MLDGPAVTDHPNQVEVLATGRGTGFTSPLGGAELVAVAADARHPPSDAVQQVQRLPARDRWQAERLAGRGIVAAKLSGDLAGTDQQRTPQHRSILVSSPGSSRMAHRQGRRDARPVRALLARLVHGAAHGKVESGNPMRLSVGDARQGILDTADRAGKLVVDGCRGSHRAAPLVRMVQRTTSTVRPSQGPIHGYGS
jgi:hypothetical protein